MNIGAFGENFPYTNFHDLNLDWIIKMIKELNDKFGEAIASKITFADPMQWDISKQYQSLTVVVNDDQAYLSIQPVPSGIDIGNTEYWQKIFDMSDFLNAVDEVDEKVDDLNNKVDTETIKNNSTKHLLYLGDSYSTFYSGALYNAIVTGLGIPSSQCHNVAVSGSSFSDPSNSFISQLQSYTGDKTEITDILVVGGINDAIASFVISAPALQSAIEAFNTYAKTEYPNAEIHVAYVGGCLPTSTLYDVHPARAQEWALWGYTSVARSLNMDVLHTWNAIHESIYYYSTDGVHPSSNYGITVIAHAVISAFNKQTVIVNRPTAVRLITGSGVSATSFNTFVSITNDIAEISAPPTAIRINQNATLSADSFAEIGTLTNTEFMLRKATYVNINVAIRGFNNVNTTSVIPATLEYENGKLYLAVYSINSAGTAWETLTAGSEAYVSLISGLPQTQVPLFDIN